MGDDLMTCRCCASPACRPRRRRRRLRPRRVQFVTAAGRRRRRPRVIAGVLHAGSLGADRGPYGVEACPRCRCSRPVALWPPAAASRERYKRRQGRWIDRPPRESRTTWQGLNFLVPTVDLAIDEMSSRALAPERSDHMILSTFRERDKSQPPVQILSTAAAPRLGRLEHTTCACLGLARARGFAIRHRAFRKCARDPTTSSPGPAEKLYEDQHKLDRVCSDPRSADESLRRPAARHRTIRPFWRPDRPACARGRPTDAAATHFGRARDRCGGTPAYVTLGTLRLAPATPPAPSRCGKAPATTPERAYLVLYGCAPPRRRRNAGALRVACRP